MSEYDSDLFLHRRVIAPGFLLNPVNELHLSRTEGDRKRVRKHEAEVLRTRIFEHYADLSRRVFATAETVSASPDDAATVTDRITSRPLAVAR